MSRVRATAGPGRPLPRLRGPRGGALPEAMVALAIALLAAAAWLPVREAASATVVAARDHGAAADGVRAAHEHLLARALGGGFADAAGPALPAGMALETAWRRWPGLPVSEVVHTATWTARDGADRRWQVAGLVFGPDPSVWAALADGPGAAVPGLIGPAGRPPAWRDAVPMSGEPTAPGGPAGAPVPPVAPVTDPGTAAPTPCPGAPTAPGLSTPVPATGASAPAPPTVAAPPGGSCPRAERMPPPDPLPPSLSMLAGSLRIDPALAASPAGDLALRTWLGGLSTPSGGSGCRAELIPATASGAWRCIVPRGRAGDDASAWLARSLAPMTRALPPALRLCRHVDVDAATPATGPGSARPPPSPDPRAPSWRLHLRLVPASDGCPTDLVPLEP